MKFHKLLLKDRHCRQRGRSLGYSRG